jgi:hypothetical protein
MLYSKQTFGLFTMNFGAQYNKKSPFAHTIFHAIFGLNAICGLSASYHCAR